MSLVRSLRGLMLLGIVVAILCSSACAVQLVSRYDEQIDIAATALQKRMDAFLTSLEHSPQPTFADSQSFYDAYLVDIRSVVVRANSHSDNSITEQQLHLMLRSVGELQEQHRSGQSLAPATLSYLRDQFNQAWGAIIRFEIAKKRGDAKEDQWF